MNKPLLLILVLIAGGLLVYMLMRAEPDTSPNVEVAKPQVSESYRGLKEIGGVKTDEKPAFEVTVEAIKQGQQQKLKFRITETHGWGVEGIIVQAFRTKLNEGTGERERDPSTKIEFMLPKPLMFGKPLEGTTTLTSVEMGILGGDVGESKDWEGEIQSHMDVYKPKS